MEFILPSHVYNIPVPEEPMQPQTITLQILQLEPYNQDEMPLLPYGEHKPLQGCQKSDEKKDFFTIFE